MDKNINNLILNYLFNLFHESIINILFNVIKLTINII